MGVRFSPLALRLWQTRPDRIGIPKGLGGRVLSLAPRFLTLPRLRCYDQSMRKIFSFLVFLALPALLALPVGASSQQAYQDYLYQFDVYRTMYRDFQTARGEFLKFQTLTSQTTALTKTKAMLTQRAMLLHTYLLLLGERLNEDQGLTPEEHLLYRSQLTAELAFLDRQKVSAAAPATLADATNHSKELEERYPKLYAIMREIASELVRGNSLASVRTFDQLFGNAKTIAMDNRNLFPPEKQVTIDRWIVQIATKRTSLQQTLDTFAQTDQTMGKAATQSEIDRWVSESAKSAASAKQQLVELTANLGELAAALQYQY